MKRKIIMLLLTLAMIITVIPLQTSAAGYLPDLKNDKSVYYTPDYRRGDCILSSTKTMMRRAAIMRKSYSWDKITNTSLRGSATIRGLLRNSFTYTCDGIKYKVVNHSLSGDSAKKIKDIKSLLASHPEGIVVWGRRAATTGMHGVLVVGCVDGKLYAIDSTHNTGRLNRGIEPWEETTMKNISNCTEMWLFSSISGGAGLGPSGASTLCSVGVREPKSIKQGNGFTIFGLVTSNYRINNVTISVVDTSGKDVINKTAAVNGGLYLIAGLDSSVKFGTLKPGKYIYRIAAVDAKKGYTVVHENSFDVVPKKNSAKAVQAGVSSAATGSVKITSVRAPSSIRKGKGFTIKGKIKASQKIRNVMVQVIDAKGNTTISASAAPNKKSYNILKLDRKVRFGKLGTGTYTYCIKVKTGSVWNTLIAQKFTVE